MVCDDLTLLLLLPLACTLSGPNRGHYITIVKSHGYWLLFDDDIVEASQLVEMNVSYDWITTCLHVPCIWNCHFTCFLVPLRRLSHTPSRASLVWQTLRKQPPMSPATSSSTSHENRVPQLNTHSVLCMGAQIFTCSSIKDIAGLLMNKRNWVPYWISLIL